MATNQTNTDDFLVLSDEAGNIYAIPRDVVERHIVTEEQKSELEKELGDDVSGYSMYQQFMNQQLAGYHQADMRAAADEARRARSASATGENEPATSTGETAATNRFRGAMTGVWRSLPFGKTASSGI